MEFQPGAAVVAKWLERAARLRLELSQRRAHPFRSVEDQKEFSWLEPDQTHCWATVQILVKEGLAAAQEAASSSRLRLVLVPQRRGT
jgi:hypothetical protein